MAMTTTRAFAEKSADEIAAARQNIANALRAMSDTFGEQDHRVVTMRHRIEEFLNAEHDMGVTLANAYAEWCVSFPDEIVRVPTKPCRCDGGWVTVEGENPGEVPSVRPCSRCNNDAYAKHFEDRGQTESRIYETAERQSDERRYTPLPPVDEEVW